MAGPQTEYLKSKADIAIYGGSAGSGKSFALLLEPLRHYNNSKFGAVCFRRTTKQVRNEGGLWDTAIALYSVFKFQFKSSTLECIAPSGMRVQFAHLEHDKTVFNYQGSQIPLIMFDELTHFSESQFWYMLSRCRSDSGVPGYIRATTNPDADHWCRKFLDWWIDQDTGFPIASRSGKIRYFVRINDQLHWADSKEELINQFGDECLPKSVTFVPAKLEDNPILMQRDPAYKANLNALPLIERLRLKDGNWNAKAISGMFFRKNWFEIVKAPPAQCTMVRYWDRASSEVSQSSPDPDYTVGLKIARDRNGVFYVIDMFRDRLSSLKVEQAIKNITAQDTLNTTPWLEVDPGQAGVFEKNYYARLLAEYNVRFNRPATNKQERSKFASAQAEAGNIKLVQAPWNDAFLSELESFPDGKHDDIVDALSGGTAALTQTGIGEFTKSMAESNAQPIMNNESLNTDW